MGILEEAKDLTAGRKLEKLDINKEIKAVFKISKTILFEVEYYTLGDNKDPDFSTSAEKFTKRKNDFERCGQCQEDLLPKEGLAYKFYKKWDPEHLNKLSNKKKEELYFDIEELIKHYDVKIWQKDSFRNTNSNWNFYELVEFSKSDKRIEAYSIY